MVTNVSTLPGGCSPQKKSGRVRSSWSYLAPVTRCSGPEDRGVACSHLRKKRSAGTFTPWLCPMTLTCVSHKLYRFCR